LAKPNPVARRGAKLQRSVRGVRARPPRSGPQGHDDAAGKSDQTRGPVLDDDAEGHGEAERVAPAYRSCHGSGFMRTVTDEEDLHADQEAKLLAGGSQRRDVWGINLRPCFGNRSCGVDDLAILERLIRLVGRLVRR